MLLLSISPAAATSTAAANAAATEAAAPALARLADGDAGGPGRVPDVGGGKTKVVEGGRRHGHLPPRPAGLQYVRMRRTVSGEMDKSNIVSPQ